MSLCNWIRLGKRLKLALSIVGDSLVRNSANR